MVVHKVTITHYATKAHGGNKGTGAGVVSFTLWPLYLHQGTNLRYPLNMQLCEPQNGVPALLKWKRQFLYWCNTEMYINVIDGTQHT